MGDQADGMEYFSATDTAFQTAQLPEPPLDDQHQPLGSDVWGRYVCHMLRLSGIEVKLAASSANPNEATWNAAQITDEASLRAAFQVKELSEIKMVTADHASVTHICCRCRTMRTRPRSADVLVQVRCAASSSTRSSSTHAARGLSL